MSHRFPAKLLSLTTICCLTVLSVANWPQREQRPSDATARPIAENASKDARAPEQAVTQSGVVMAGYTFNAPPLPDPAALARRVEEKRPQPTVDRPAAKPSVSQEASDVRPRPAIVRLARRVSAPVGHRQSVFAAPSSPDNDNLWQPENPAASNPRFVRLPPVDGITNPPSPASLDNPAPQVPANPLRNPAHKRNVSKLRPPQPRHVASRVTALPNNKKPRVSIDNAAVQTNLQPAAPNHAPHESPRSPQAQQPVVAARLPGPDPALIAVNRQAMDLVRNGQSLAVRNAQYSARADFIQALRLIAQAHDAIEGGSRHTKHLAAGLLALREAEDFVPSGAGRWSDQFDVQVIASGHGTPIIRELPDDNEALEMTTWIARQKYYTFAQQELALAGADEPVASTALFSLGKLYVARNGTSGKGNLVSSAQAMAFFQAALQVDSGNYIAANELGVLLARFGQLNDARAVLRHAVAVKPDFPPIWNNLAIVHQRMGEVDLERRARRELKLAQQRGAAGQTSADIGDSIHWVAPETFANLAGRPPQPRSAARPAAEVEEKDSETKKPAWQFWK